MAGPSELKVRRRIERAHPEHGAHTSPPRAHPVRDRPRTLVAGRGHVGQVHREHSAQGLLRNARWGARLARPLPCAPRAAPARCHCPRAAHRRLKCARHAARPARPALSSYPCLPPRARASPPRRAQAAPRAGAPRSSSARGSAPASATPNAVTSLRPSRSPSPPASERAATRAVRRAARDDVNVMRPHQLSSQSVRSECRHSEVAYREGCTRG